VRATEVELTQRLLAGDESALAPLLETIQRKVFQYTWLMCGQREDAEEVAQDTLLKVSQNWRQLQDPQRIKPWMFSIARNCCLMKRRKSVFAPAAELPVDDLPLTTSEPDPETQLLQHEITAELEAALRLLPDTYRAVLLLRDREEMSTSETAELLGLSEDATKQRLHRGRAMLRRHLLPRQTA
jgi:RNA polymerase sigma-70 factor (ECF subfamily)